VTIARKAWPEWLGQGGHGLAHLKKQLALEFQHHDAGEDARAAAQVVLLAEERLGRPLVEGLQQAAPR
jgi:DNA polymerase-3 subunit epsilon